MVTAIPTSQLGAFEPNGHIDFFGYSSSAGGWFFCGWSTDVWQHRRPTAKVIAHFKKSGLLTDALLAWYDRPDLANGAVGVVVFLPGVSRAQGELFALDIQGDSHESGVRITPVRPVEQLREHELTPRALSIMGGAYGHPDSMTRLVALLSRRGYAGRDTVQDLPVFVQVEIDETIFISPDGLVMIGWMVDPTLSISAVRVRSGHLCSEDISKRILPVLRHDVVEALAVKYGVSDPFCGLIAYAPNCIVPNEQIYLEVELLDGSIGYKAVPNPVKLGMPAIRRVLEGYTLTPDVFEGVFNDIIGPAVFGLNKVRLEGPRLQGEVAFGPVNPNPKCSIIIPLYGRMDFLQYQMAFFSERETSKYEFIYVLDDPPRKAELLGLANTVWARFGVPFRIVMLKTNLGYAPANNVGLASARGEYTCYLNSDVMPDEPNWLDIMIADLEADETLGLVGGLLLFEDGTVQHQGMAFERLSAFADWPFPYHPGKGRRPRPRVEPIERVEAVTGACMLLKTGLARELGGFDEIYAIGDFEDSDLCMKVRRKGLDCAVDHRARLWHLERQSQAGSKHSWRMYLTLYNAWVHKNRWFADAAKTTL
jgi:GT2 family glycosyltransferase